MVTIIRFVNFNETGFKFNVVFEMHLLGKLYAIAFYMAYVKQQEKIITIKIIETLLS